MQKKWLESIEPVPLSEGSSKKTNKYVIESQLLQHAKGNVLELDVYTYVGNSATRELFCRHFIKAEKEYATWFGKQRKLKYRTYEKGWNNSQLERVLDGGVYQYAHVSERDIHFSRQAKEIIGQYFEDNVAAHIADTTWQIITTIENYISREKRERAEERKKNRIQNLMDAVEPMDDEFKDWVKTLFPERYLFADTYNTKRGYRCRCSVCEKNYFAKEKPKHNEDITCKKCNAPVKVKTRTHYINIEKKVFVLQSLEDMTLMRHFRVTQSSSVATKRASTSYVIHERVRMFRNEETPRDTKTYYSDPYGQDGDWTDKKHGKVIDTYFYLYPKGIEETQLDKGIRSALVQAAVAGKLMQYNSIVRYTSLYRQTEYLIKGRYYRLVNDQMDTWGIAEWLDYNADNLPDMLKLDKQRALRLREMNGGDYALRALQWEEFTGQKISQENLEYIDGVEIDVEDLELKRTGLSINKMINYLRRQQSKEKTSIDKIMNIYKDYLDMAQQRGANLHDDIVRVNPKMREFHDRYVEERQREQDEKRAFELSKKYSNIEKDYERNCELFGWEDGEYAIVVPRNVLEIMQEGRKQHHCVGTNETYMKSMNERTSFIFFLRKKPQLDTPWYTLEVSADLNIRQKCAAYNRQPDIKEVNKILTRWKKKITERQAKMQAAIKAAVYEVIWNRK